MKKVSLIILGSLVLIFCFWFIFLKQENYDRYPYQVGKVIIKNKGTFIAVIEVSSYYRKSEGSPAGGTSVELMTGKSKDLYIPKYNKGGQIIFQVYTGKAEYDPDNLAYNMDNVKTFKVVKFKRVINSPEKHLICNYTVSGTAAKPEADGSCKYDSGHLK